MDVSKRAYNFCAGPAALPTEVLERARAEMLDWRGKGLSVMEMSHRSDDYVAIASEFRSLAHLPGVHKAKLFEPKPQEVYTWKV